ncbi:MAG: hypothetical protein JEZ00_19280 [Anaerolineaceae bacterium]|nr:hypothetical protein [Anaerolineaceae bacterium]
MDQSQNTVVVRKSTLWILLGLIVLIPLFFGLSLSSDVFAKTIDLQEASPTMVPTSIPPDECLNDPTSSACLALCAENPLQDFCLSAANACAEDNSEPFCNDLCTMDSSRSFCIDLCTTDTALPYCGNLCAGNPDQPFCSDVCAAADPANTPEYCTLVACQTKPHSAGCDTLCEQDPSQSFCADFCTSSENPQEISFCQNLCIANPNQGFCDRICSESDDPLAIGYCVEVCTTDSNRPYCEELCLDPRSMALSSDFCKSKCEFNNGKPDDGGTYCLDYCEQDPSQPYCTDMCTGSSYKYDFCEAIPCSITTFSDDPKCGLICTEDPTNILCQQVCANSNSGILYLSNNNADKSFCEVGCEFDPTMAHCSSLCQSKVKSGVLAPLQEDMPAYCASSCLSNPDQSFCSVVCDQNPELCMDTCKSNPKTPGCEELCEITPDLDFCRETCKNSDSYACRATRCYDDPDSSWCNFYCTNSAGAYDFCADVCEKTPEKYYCVNVCEEDPLQPFCVDACNNTEHPAWYPFCSDICNTIEDPTEYPYCRTLCESKVNMGAYCADICEKNAYWWCPDTCISNPGNDYCVSQCEANPDLVYCNQTCLLRPDLPYCQTRCENMEEDGKLYAHCVASCHDHPFSDSCEFMCDNFILKAEHEIEAEPPENGTRSEPVTPIPSYCEEACVALNDHPDVTDVGLANYSYCGDLCALRNDGVAPDYCVEVCDRSYYATGGYHVDAMIDFCDDVCFDIKSKPDEGSLTNPVDFCTNVCVNRMAQDGALEIAGAVLNQIEGKILSTITDLVGYESYTELPYCYLLEDTLPPGFLLREDYTENKDPDWTPYLETRDPCDSSFTTAGSLECLYQHAYVDDTTGGGLDCTKNPTLPVCLSNCKNAVNPSELNYCYGICNKDPQAPFCDKVCELSSNAEQFPFCVDKCTIPDEPPNWLRFPELYSGELLTQERPEFTEDIPDSQYADHPDFCNAFVCEHFAEFDCPALICSSASNPEAIPSCVNQCAKDASLDFCPDICADNPYGYSFCLGTQTCDVNPNQTKCKTECSNAADPSQLSWCEGLCRRDGSLSFCTGFCENAEDIHTPFCTATCKANPDSGVCDALCELNPANSFCADLCKANPEKDFCTALCNIPGSYQDYESICASVCDINPYLHTCGLVCSFSNTSYDFCQDRCAFITIDGGSFNTCSNPCMENPNLPICVSSCEDTSHGADFVAVFDWCDDICKEDPGYSFCWDNAECYNDYIPYGGIPEVCMASCDLNDKLPYCDDLCTLKPDNPWCADRCIEELDAGNPVPDYCKRICTDTDDLLKEPFCQDMCRDIYKQDSTYGFCGDICNALEYPLSEDYCVAKCTRAKNYEEYPYCAEKCNQQAQAGLAPEAFESFCWDGIDPKYTCTEPFTLALCEANPTTEGCSGVCTCNEKTLLEKCANSDNPAEALCCVDYCQSEENADEPFCGDICATDSTHDFCTLRCTSADERFTPYCGEICKAEDSWSFCGELCDAQYDEAFTNQYCMANANSPCCDRICEEDPDLPFCGNVCNYTANPTYCAQQCDSDPNQNFCHHICESNPDSPWCMGLCEEWASADYCQAYCQEDPNLEFCKTKYINPDAECWPGAYAPGIVAGCAENERAMCNEEHIWTCFDPSDDACCEDIPGIISPPDFE